MDTDRDVLIKRIEKMEVKVYNTYSEFLLSNAKVDTYLSKCEQNMQEIKNPKDIEVILPVKPTEINTPLTEQNTPIHIKSDIPVIYKKLRDFFIDDFVTNKNYYTTVLKGCLSNMTKAETIFDTLGITTHKHNSLFMNSVRASAKEYKSINGIM